MKKTILVTGGAGFIGYHLCLHLLKKNFNVICIDNINNYYSQKLKNDRLKNLFKFKNFEFLKLNLSKQKSIAEALRKKKIHKIVHLAAQAGVRYAYINPKTYFDNNLKVFFNIIEFARKNKITEILCASTSSIYGDQKKFPIKEKFETSRPIQFYAATKKSNEVMAYSYYKMFKINFVFMRFFTVYGPWGRPDMSIFKFVKNIKENKIIQIFNYGNHTRDFTYIDDIVDGITKLINKKNNGFFTFNIGNTKKVKLMYIVKKIESLLKKKAKIEYLPLQPGDIQKTHSSTKLLNNYTGYKSKTKIDEGLSKFVKWFNDYYK